MKQKAREFAKRSAARFVGASEENRQQAIADFIRSTAQAASHMQKLLEAARYGRENPEVNEAIAQLEEQIQARAAQMLGHELAGFAFDE